jgi:hypothetical protein
MAAYARQAKNWESRGEKVFEVRWDKAGGFKVVQYDQGDWERMPARLGQAPIPFE